jgi:hypothetical protein
MNQFFLNGKLKILSKIKKKYNLGFLIEVTEIRTFSLFLISFLNQRNKILNFGMRYFQNKILLSKLKFDFFWLNTYLIYLADEPQKRS